MNELKGQPGYINQEKKKRGIRSGLTLAAILIILITGYLVNGTRLNWFTFIAIMMCLPWAKMFVQFITIFPYHSIGEDKELKLTENSSNLTMVYETIITSTERIMPIEATAIHNNTVCCYTNNQKINISEVKKYLKLKLEQNLLKDVSVKVYDEFEDFQNRVIEMNRLTTDNYDKYEEKEKQIKRMLLTLSL